MYTESHAVCSLMDVHVGHNIYVNYTMYCIHISIIVYDSHVGQCLDALKKTIPTLIL